MKHTQLVCGLCPQISRLCQSTPELSGQRCAPPSHVGHSRNGALAQSLGAYCVLSVDWATETGRPVSCIDQLTAASGDEARVSTTQWLPGRVTPTQRHVTKLLHPPP